MDELQHSREKERNRIKDMLFLRRQKGANGQALQSEEERLLKEFEETYDKKVYTKL